MRVLISNDDGIQAEGIRVLSDVAEKLKYDVTVIAPHRERSAAGHSITLHKPLRMKEVRPNHYALTGTPVDCIYVGTRHLLKDSKPDMVLSGINIGENLGDSIYYSGTVAAAREGAIFGVPSVAFSIVVGHHPERHKLHWETCSSFIEKFLPQFLSVNKHPHYYYNINIPNVALKDLKGIRVCRQGQRFYKDMVTVGSDPREKKYYWIGGPYNGHDNNPDSDCSLAEQGYVTIVPLHLDATAEDALEDTKKWQKVLG